MLNTVCQLKSPRQFEVVFKKLELDARHLLVRPTHLSICQADQRYYQGTRPEEILKEKLPMSLIHEAVGTVIYDPTGSFHVGDTVVLIPNQPVERHTLIAENYLRSSKFCASSMDGFLQEYVQMAPDRVLPVPDGINPSAAAFSEFASVSFHALGRLFAMSHAKMDEVAIWGDGSLGYLTALLLRYMRPNVHLYVIGTHEEKLSYFTFADGTALTTQLTEDFAFDHALECVGGVGSASAINQIIHHIRPEGTIALMGVSEEFVPLDTRMILEKGLRIIGNSRSGREDFAGLFDLYRRHNDLTAYLDHMIGMEYTVRDIKDICNAFEADIHKLIGKTVMIWDE